MSFRTLILFFFTVLIVSCNTEEEAKTKLKIGFSQCTNYDEWRKSMLNEMERELTFHDNVEFFFKDAMGDSELQKQHIRELTQINEVDILIISPNEADALTEEVIKVYQNGIPTILLDRTVNTELYSAYIGADNNKIGKLIARYISNKLENSKSKSTILEIRGNQKYSPFKDRHNGFYDEIMKNQGVELKILDGDWATDGVTELEFDRLINENPDLKYIYGHSDYLSYLAYNRLPADLKSKVKIIGIDGLLVPNGGIDLVDKGVFEATFIYPTGGAESIRTAISLANKTPVNHKILLTSDYIDTSNISLVKSQINKLKQTQDDINKLVNQYNTIQYRFSLSKTYNVVMLITSIIFIVLIFYILRIHKKSKELLKVSEAKSEEISLKNIQLNELTKELEISNESKIQFFMNITHEFKTPLSIIMGLVDQVKNDMEHFEYNVIKRNIFRLLNLFNQLTTFRKIETDKLEMNVSKVILQDFIEDILNSFQFLAKKKKVKFIFDHNVKTDVWIDVNLFDKVIFNLISNALNYTPKNESIKIIVEEGLDNIVFSVCNMGAPIPLEEQSKIFDRYYRTKYNIANGSGLGLPLSKSIIAQHNGSIEYIQNTYDYINVFQVKLLKGNNHFNSELIASGKEEFIKSDISLIGDDILYKNSIHKDDNNKLSALIVEDNVELYSYLEKLLGNEYNISIAISSEEGYSQTLEIVPDIIITDLKLPNASGLELLEKIRSDYRISHIPIIVLTSDDRYETKVNALRLGADDFVTKPFIPELLLERISTTILNREKLKDYYSSELPTKLKNKGQSLDKKFLYQFKTICEENLSDETLNVDDIALQMNVSKVQLYRKLKAILGYSVKEYINDLRLKKASALLKETDKTIAEIAYEVGYSSPSYFSTSFKSKHNITPNDFRRQT